MPFAETLLGLKESGHAEDSRLIGENKLYETLTAEDREEIADDMRLYPTNKGKGKHTSLEYMMIVQR